MISDFSIISKIPNIFISILFPWNKYSLQIIMVQGVATGNWWVRTPTYVQTPQCKSVEQFFLYIGGVPRMYIVTFDCSPAKKIGWRCLCYGRKPYIYISHPFRIVISISNLWCIHNLLRDTTSETNNNWSTFPTRGPLIECHTQTSQSICYLPEWEYFWNSPETFHRSTKLPMFPVPVGCTDRSSSVHRWRSSSGWPHFSSI